MGQVKATGAVNNAAVTLITKDGRVVEISLSLSQLRDTQGKVSRNRRESARMSPRKTVCANNCWSRSGWPPWARRWPALPIA